jgi:hypothetical protein
MVVKKNKKGDMNFWLVLGALAIIFMFAVFFVMTDIMAGFKGSTESVQGDVDEKIKEVDLDFLDSGDSDDSDGSGGS